MGKTVGGHRPTLTDKRTPRALYPRGPLRHGHGDGEGIGRLFAPPFGVCSYAAGAIGRIDPNLGIRPIMAYLFTMRVGLVVVAAFPWVFTGFL